MKKIIFITALLIGSVVAWAGQNPLSIQPYVGGEVRARLGSQKFHELTRMRIGMWAYPSSDVDLQFEYNGLSAKPTYAYGRAHRLYGRWELSALVGRHLNPVGWTVPGPYDQRLARLDIGYEPFLATTYATGGGVWVKYDSLATLRASSFDSTDAAVCLTIVGISQFWQDGVGYGGRVSFGEFLHRRGLRAGYGGYELLPYFGYVDLESNGADPWVTGADFATPWPVQLHWLQEGVNDDTWNSFGASIQYLRRSFIKMMYDGRFETTRVDVSFYAAW